MNYLDNNRGTRLEKRMQRELEEYWAGSITGQLKNKKVVDIDQERCENCKSKDVEYIYENNGFSFPDGPSKVECVGIACLDCGHKENF